MSAVVRSRSRIAAFTPRRSGRPSAATAAGEPMYSASDSSIGSSCTGWAVQNSQLVWSSVPSKLRNSVPGGTGGAPYARI